MFNERSLQAEGWAFAPFSYAVMLSEVLMVRVVADKEGVGQILLLSLDKLFKCGQVSLGWDTLWNKEWEDGSVAAYQVQWWNVILAFWSDTAFKSEESGLTLAVNAAIIANY